MTTAELKADLEAGCAIWLKHFSDDPRPVSTRVLVRKGEDAGLTRFVMQLAMWELVGTGEICLRPDWLLEPAPPVTVRNPERET